MFDSYTKLLLHFENDVRDITGKIVTNNNVTFGNTNPKFNSYGIFNGTTSYLSIPDSDDFYFGTGNFTIDFWVRFNDLTPVYGFVGSRVDDNNNWFILKDSNHCLRMYFVSASIEEAYYIMSYPWSGLAINTWYHLCFERVGPTAKIFIDGVSQTLNEQIPFGTNDVGNVNALLKIGLVSLTYYLNGHLDELRISKGIARWTENFTPPIQPYGISPLPTFYKS